MKLGKMIKNLKKPHALLKLLIVVAILYIIYHIAKKYFLKEAFTNPTTCTYYYMEQCGHCKRFSPEWDKFTQSYTGPVRLRKVEMNNAGDDLNKYNINGFPTILFVNDNGESQQYEGPRTSDALNKFINSL
jgi:thioredoxin-like negative regulator of GroEL